jgi:2,3-dihydroxybiphenyl 1,2-dioxygenase
MTTVSSVAYLVIEVPDPAPTVQCLTDVVGLMPGDRAGQLRNDGLAHRITVQEGPRNDAVAVGFDTGSAGGLAALVAQLRAAGYDVVDGSADDCSARQVDGLARVTAPWGVDVELTHGLASASSGYSSQLMPSGFLTGQMGFGHVVFATTNFDESTKFVTEGLGLGRSDWLDMELAPGLSLHVEFFHCNERHHTIALAHAPFELPTALHHVMVEVNDRDDVGAAYDRAFEAGLPLPNGLGKHDNDGMFSFYLQTPAGFQVEVGHGARRVIAPWTDDRAYSRISAWGHQPVSRAS